MKIKSDQKLNKGTIIEMEESKKYYEVLNCVRIDIFPTMFGLTLKEVEVRNDERR